MAWLQLWGPGEGNAGLNSGLLLLLLGLPVSLPTAVLLLPTTLLAPMPSFRSCDCLSGRLSVEVLSALLLRLFRLLLLSAGGSCMLLSVVYAVPLTASNCRPCPNRAVTSADRQLCTTSSISRELKRVMMYNCLLFCWNRVHWAYWQAVVRW